MMRRLVARKASVYQIKWGKAMGRVGAMLGQKRLRKGAGSFNNEVNLRHKKTQPHSCVFHKSL